MKYYLFFTAMLLLTIHVTAQSRYETFSNDDHSRIGIILNHSNYGDRNYHTTGAGLNVEWSGKRFGVGYSAILGYGSEGNLYASSGIGQVAGFWLFTNGGSQLPYWAFIGTLLPETFLFYGYPANRARLGFYLSPWSVEYKGNNSTDEETKVSISAGLRCAVRLKNYYAEPFAGVKTIYATRRVGLNAGLTIYFQGLSE